MSEKNQVIARAVFVPVEGRPKLKDVIKKEADIESLPDKPKKQEQDREERGSMDQQNKKKAKSPKKRTRGKKQKQAQREKKESPEQEESPKKKKQPRKKRERQKSEEAPQVPSNQSLPVRFQAQKEDKEPPKPRVSSYRVLSCKEVICELCQSWFSDAQAKLKHDGGCAARNRYCFDCEECFPQILYEEHFEQCAPYINRIKKEKLLKQTIIDTNAEYDRKQEECVCQRCKPIPPLIVPPPPPPPPPSVSSERQPFGMEIYRSISAPIVNGMEFIRDGLFVRTEAARAQIPRLAQSQHYRPPCAATSVVPRECPVKLSRLTNPIFKEYDEHIKIRRDFEFRERKLDCIPRRLYVPKNYEVDDCNFCCTEMRLQEQVAEFSCGHMMHIQCASKWLFKNQRCPICMNTVLKM